MQFFVSSFIGHMRIKSWKNLEKMFKFFAAVVSSYICRIASSWLERAGGQLGKLANCGSHNFVLIVDTLFVQSVIIGLLYSYLG